MHDQANTRGLMRCYEMAYACCATIALTTYTPTQHANTLLVFAVLYTTQTHTHTHARNRRTSAYIHTYIHTYIHIHMYMHAYIHRQLITRIHTLIPTVHAYTQDTLTAYPSATSIDTDKHTQQPHSPTMQLSRMHNSRHRM